MEFKVYLSDEEYKKCKEFADASSKTQREYRSGGTQKRSSGLIFYDTLRGKVGEMVVKKFLEQEPLSLVGINLDFGIYDRGVWDSEDIEINGKRISIKSSKYFARCLMLESKDINRGDFYDYYILVLIDKDFKSGNVAGFAYKDEIVKDNPKTLRQKKGEKLIGTQTILDADNHIRQKK